MKQMGRFLYLVIPLALLPLCLAFLDNPLLFDDQDFFLQGVPEQFFANGWHPLTPRWWVYETLAATFVYAGPGIRWLRVGNLCAHAGTGIALFFLVRRLLLDLDTKIASATSADVAAFVAAILFVLHPMAIFTQAYLVQRTIVCGTLFSLLSWLAFWRGLSGSRVALAMSVFSFTAAVYAKEHALMVPVVSLCLWCLYRRSGLSVKPLQREIWVTLLAQGLLAGYLVVRMKSLLATPYEPSTAEFLAGDVSIDSILLYPLSVLNQAGLYFKYVLLWVLPNSAQMSIDIREPFPPNFSSWTLWGGLILYATYGAVSLKLLLRGDVTGLVGFALLVPWLLFATEFSTVRLQESFVIYRSYLWAPCLFLMVALGVRRLKPRMSYVLLPLFALYLIALSVDRLTTFSRDILWWNEAAQHLERRSQGNKVLGAYRIYYNRGNAYYRAGMLEAALADYDLVTKLKPNFAHAYHQRAVVYFDLKRWNEAQQDFSKAIILLPDNVKSYVGRARVLQAVGNSEEARKTLQFVCTMVGQFPCELLQDE